MSLFKRCPLCFLFGYRECPDPFLAWQLMGFVALILVVVAVVLI